MTQALPFTKIFLLLRHTTVPLMILRAISVSQKKDSFFVLYLNTRSMNKNFESFKYSIVCFSGTWVDHIFFSKNSDFSLSGYKVTSSKKNLYEGRSLSFCAQKFYL